MQQPSSITAHQIALLALDRRSAASFPRFAPLPASHLPCDVEVTERDVLVSRFFRCDGATVVTGGAGLAEFLGYSLSLENLLDTCTLLGNRAMHISQRYLGPIESCLIGIAGRWTDLGASRGMLAFAMDGRRSRLYAFRRSTSGALVELCYAELPSRQGASLEWLPLCGLPPRADVFLDASHFVPTEHGLCGLVRMATSDGAEVSRLLTIREMRGESRCAPEMMWSEPMSGVTILRPDYRNTLAEHFVPARATALLAEEPTSSGYALKRLVGSDAPLPALAYFDQAARQPPTVYIPPVLNP